MSDERPINPDNFGVQFGRYSASFALRKIPEVYQHKSNRHSAYKKLSVAENGKRLARKVDFFVGLARKERDKRIEPYNVCRIFPFFPASVRVAIVECGCKGIDARGNLLRATPIDFLDYCRILHMLSAKFQPIRLSRRAEPFDSSDFIYEIKHDGFRALASVHSGECQLVSRNGNVFRGFKDLAEWVGRLLKVDAVLDGEIVVLDEYGRSQFNDLLFRRGAVYFYAFDLLSLHGEDLRILPLIERKARLRKLVRRGRSHLLFVDHIEGKGCEFFRRICELDLEGIVAKRASFELSSHRPTVTRLDQD